MRAGGTRRKQGSDWWGARGYGPGGSSGTWPAIFGSGTWVA